MNGGDIEARVSRLEKALSRFASDLRLALQYVRSDAASSVTKSRLIMEKLLERIYVTEMGREPRKPLLGEMLADNQFTRKIERRILARMNAIRDMGNLGPHGEEVRPGDAVRVLEDLCEVIEWYAGRYAGGSPQHTVPPTPSGGAEKKLREEATVRELSRELLVADSWWELQGLLYKVNNFLAEYPHSVEGQLLRDRVSVALRNVAASTPSGTNRTIADATPEPRGRAKPAWGAPVLALLAFILLGMTARLFLRSPAPPPASGPAPPPSTKLPLGTAPSTKPGATGASAHAPTTARTPDTGSGSPVAPGDTGKSVAAERPPPLDCTGPDGVSAADVRKAQEAWAQYLGRKVEETVEIAPGVKMTFVLVPPGKFRMGSLQGETGREDDEALHTVFLTEPFDLARTELTQQQYEALTGNNPSNFKGADLPVERVSWDEARECGVKLTEKRADQHVYRLPSEAEWEYACRGGRPSTRPFGVGDGSSLSSREANFDGKDPYGAAKGAYLQMTCPVGSYKANALGLFDLHGNVSEWCADFYAPYPDATVSNPTGPAKGTHRVNRGGGWNYTAGSCRAAFRSKSVVSFRNNYLGFRLARTLPPRK